MNAFTDPACLANYVEKTARIVPGMHDMHRMAALLIAETAPVDARVLVLGAGGGLELKALASAQAGWRFHGVDPSAEMLQLARDHLGLLAARVDWCQGYIDDAAEGPFDAATCLLTLHFLPAPERLQTLQAMHHRLKPGAALVVAHHSFPTTGAEQDTWLQRYATYTQAPGVDAAQRQHTINALRERLPVLSPEADVGLMQDAGFVDVELFYCALTFKGWVARRA